MNTATQNLEHDHVFILRLTDVMLAMVDKLSTNADHFELVVNLIRKFADGLHHAKEEDLLFPLMGEKGFSPEQGPVAVMLHEHEQGRAYVKGVSDGIAALRAEADGALQAIYDNMTGYAQLLQNHIGKENNILFRMADQVFSAEEQQELLTQFAEVEGNAETEFDSANSIQKINDLAAIYLQ
jgi:hemerythrin-like domain-containing protein